MTDLSLFHSLPDALWIFILSEWIDTPRVLCALDMAMCNRSLRVEYLQLLQRAVPLSKYHFHGFNKKRLSKIFYDWSNERNAFPRSLSMRLDVTSEKNDWKSMKKILQCVETLSASTSIFPLIDVLTGLPKLKSLDLCGAIVSMDHNAGDSIEPFQQEKLPLAFEHSVYHLKCLTLEYVMFPARKLAFETLIRVCPLLEVVELSTCGNICLQHVDYLISHTRNLRKLSYKGYYVFHKEIFEVPEVNEEQQSSAAATTLTSLSLALGMADTLFWDQKEQFVCDILDKCLCLEEVSLKGCNFYENSPHSTKLATVIKKNWHRLKFLKLDESDFPKAFIRHVASSAAASLQHLSSSCGFEESTILEVIGQSFAALQTLQLGVHFQQQFSLAALQNAVFQHTLQTFIIRGKDFAFEDPHHVLASFSALQNIELSLKDYDYLIYDVPLKRQAEIIQLKLKSFRFDMPGIYEYHYGIEDVPPLDYTLLNLSRFHSLQELSLESVYLYPEELSIVLSLPSLQHLRLVRIVAYNDKILFHPDNYPSEKLSPLKTLYLNSRCYLRWNMEFLKTLLGRFPLLTELSIDEGALEMECWKQLREEYRYRCVTLTMILSKYMNHTAANQA